MYFVPQSWQNRFIVAREWLLPPKVSMFFETLPAILLTAIICILFVVILPAVDIIILALIGVAAVAVGLARYWWLMYKTTTNAAEIARLQASSDSHRWRLRVEVLCRITAFANERPHDQLEMHSTSAWFHNYAKMAFHGKLRQSDQLPLSGVNLHQPANLMVALHGLLVEVNITDIPLVAPEQYAEVPPSQWGWIESNGNLLPAPASAS